MSYQIEVSFQFTNVDAPVVVVAYQGREAINELFLFELTVVSDHALDVNDIIAASGTLTFMTEGRELRAIHGAIARCVDLLTTEAARYHYRLRFVPELWRSSLVELIDIYLDMDVRTLIEHKLAMVGLEVGEDYVLRLTENYAEREFVVQYEETDLAFLSRQLEHFGVSFFFEHQANAEVLVIGDGNHAFSPFGEGSPGYDDNVPFYPRGERTGVFELSVATDVIPAQYIQRDYNYRKPDSDLTADVAIVGPGRAGSIYEYGAHFTTSEEAGFFAQLRSEEHGCRRKVMEGKSLLPQLRAGGSTTVSGHPRGDMDLIITSVEHRGQQGFDAKDGVSYENSFTAITQDVIYRPRRKTPKPRISGVMTGIIENEADSEYADVDDQGRYRVRFLFDTAPEDERQASQPVRMMQPHAGPGYGMHFPLRGGVEVLIAFVGGDPDRPIIAGTVPNPRTKSPVASDNRERNVIRTGSGNEINIDDTDGEERIKISTPRSSATLQLGSPNAPEDGAALQSSTSTTTAATGSTNALGAFNNSWSLWSSLWGNHVTAVAGKVMFVDVIKYGLDTISGGLGTISGWLGTALSVADLVNRSKAQDIVDQQKKVDNAEKTLADTADAADKSADTYNSAQTNLVAKIAAIDTSGLSSAEQTALAAKVTDYNNARTAVQSRQSELAALQAQKAAAEANGDYETAQAIDDLIAAKQIEVTTAITARNTALAALDTAIEDQAEALSDDLEAKQDELADLQDDDPVDQAAIDAKQLEVNAAQTKANSFNTSDFDTAKTSFDSAKTDYDTKKAAHDAATTDLPVQQADLAKKKKALADAEESWKGTNDAKGYIDKVVTPAFALTAVPYSWYTTIFATGMQGYAANCTNVMLDEAHAQREGRHKKQYQIGESNTWGYGPKAPKEDGDARTTTGWGALSEVPWFEPKASVESTDPLFQPGDDDPYHKVYLQTGGGAGLAGTLSGWRLALAGVLSAAFGPIAGAVVFQFMKKSAAFNESRNIQGSEQKAVLFGKESAFVNGQLYTTISSGKHLLMTADEDAVLHTRGSAEVVGIDNLYLASAKRVDVLSRGSTVLRVTDRGGKDDVSKDKALATVVMSTYPAQKEAGGKPGKPIAKGKQHGEVTIETRDNSANNTAMSRLGLEGPKVYLWADSSKDFKDAKVIISAFRKDKRMSYLEVSEANNKRMAKLLAGSFGVDVESNNAGKKGFARLSAAGIRVEVTESKATVGAPGKPAHLSIEPTKKTSLRGDTELTLCAPTKIALVSKTIEFGGAFNHVHLNIKEGPANGATVSSLRQMIRDAKKAGQDAMKEAKQVGKDLDTEISTRRKRVEQLYDKLEKDEDERKEKYKR